MSLIDYLRNKRIFIEDAAKYRELRREIYNSYEKKKLCFLELQRRNTEEKKQHQLIVEINVLAGLLGKEKIDENNTHSTIRAYPDSLL